MTMGVRRTLSSLRAGSAWGTMGVPPGGVCPRIFVVAAYGMGGTSSISATMCLGALISTVGPAGARGLVLGIARFASGADRR